MKLIFKQRFFSWLDNYDIYDEQGHVIYSIKGKISWGHRLEIYDQHQHIGTLKEEVLTWKPKFHMYIHDQYIGCIEKELTLLKPQFKLDCRGWKVTGNWLAWEYQIQDKQNLVIADISKDISQLGDTYVLDIVHPDDALYVLMIVLAIDAEKCSHNH